MDTRKAADEAPRRRLAELLACGEPVDLVEGALVIATCEYPDLDLAREKSRIAEIASEAARRANLLENRANPFARLHEINAYLFEELGFRGNSRNYDDPRNSFLNQVMDRRTGIPLTLSILTMEVARAAGFAARGIALPGHFIVRLDLEGRTILADPFSGGRVLSREDCQRLVVRGTGRASMFRPEMLQGAPVADILTRMLRNLKRIYLSREDYRRAEVMVDLLLITTAGDPLETRDRGILMAHLGQVGEAISDLEAYLRLRPNAPDRESIRSRLDWLRQRSAKPAQK